MGKISSTDYLDALDAASDWPDESADDTEAEHSDGSGLNGEAERAARAAPAPHRRADGQVLGSVANRLRPLTQAQRLFVEGVIQGATLRQAYRDSHPNDKTSDAAISANAWRLSKHPKVAAMLSVAWEQTVEVLADDLAATRRYVMRQLVAASRELKQEGSRLKALEMLGRASGTFTQTAVAAPEVVTADQLKRDLAGHLRLLDTVKPIKGKAA
jgi:hypothetical protein